MGVSQHQPKIQPVAQTGRTGAGQANRPDHEAAAEAQPQLSKTDQFRPSAELSEAQTVKPAGQDPKVNELKKSSERTRSQAASSRAGNPKASQSKGGAANVQAPKQATPASAAKQIQQSGTGQTHMGDRKRPRAVDRGSYISNLIATFGGGGED